MITVMTKVGSDQLKQREGISQAASPNKTAAAAVEITSDSIDSTDIECD